MVGVLGTKLRRDLRRQRGQFGAVAVTIFLGVTLFGASYDAYRNLNASYEQAFVEYRFANLTVTGGDVRSFARTARRRPGVEAVSLRTQADVPVQVRGTKLLGRVVGMPPGHQPAVNRVEVEDGKLPARNAPREVLVERHMADNFGLEPGDALALGGGARVVRVRVAGIAASPEYFWPARSRQDLLPSPDDFGVVFAPEPLAARIGGGLNQAAVYFKNGDEDAGLEAALAARARRTGAADVLTRSDQPSNSALEEDLKGFEELALLFPLLFLTAAALTTTVLLRRLVVTQKPIIGMLRAAGYSRASVVLHYLGFGLAAAGAGGLLGAAAGQLLAGAVTRAYTSELSIPVTLTGLSPATAAAGVGFALLTGVLAAAAPALAAAGTPPAEAMRRFAPAGGGRLSLLERIAPPLRRLPVRWRMVLRGIGRNRRRTLSTVIGVVLAMTLILVSWGMLDTTDILVKRQFGEVERQDAQVYFAGPIGKPVLDGIRRVNGVAAAEPAIEVPATLRANGRLYQTSLVGLKARTAMHGFPDRGDGAPGLPQRGLIAGTELGPQLGISPGDEVAIAIPAADVTASAPVREFVNEPLGTYAYASFAAIRHAVGSLPGIGNTVLVRYEPGTDPAQMRRKLSALPGVVAFEDSSALLRTVQDYLGLFYAFVGIMLVFGGAMAFALLFNSITTSIAERSVEVATLRAAGLPFRSLASMITAENMLVSALGLLPGLLVGYEVAGAFMSSFSSDQFNFDLEIRTTTLIFSCVAIMLVALISQIPGLRAVKRLDIAEVVRERSA